MDNVNKDALCRVVEMTQTVPQAFNDLMRKDEETGQDCFCILGCLYEVYRQDHPNLRWEDGALMDENGNEFSRITRLTTPVMDYFGLGDAHRIETGLCTALEWEGSLRSLYKLNDEEQLPLIDLGQMILDQWIGGGCD